MRRAWLLVVSLLIISVPQDADAVPKLKTIKPGATCTKLNKTQIIKNLKFTCIKSGKRLIWNNGSSVTNKPINPPNSKKTPENSSLTPESIPSTETNPLPVAEIKKPLFDPYVDCNSTIGNCPAVSSTLNSSIDECKIQDLSGPINRSMSIGFPRPNFIQTQKSNPEVLLIPVSFTDLEFNNPQLELKEELDFVRQLYKNTSWNKVNITFTFVPDRAHLRINENFEQYKSKYNSDLGLVTEKLLQSVEYEEISEKEKP